MTRLQSPAETRKQQVFVVQKLVNWYFELERMLQAFVWELLFK